MSIVGAEVCHRVEGSPLRRLPHRALGGFSVAHQHVHALIGTLQLPGVQRHSEADRQALPQGSGGHIDERQARRRMAFKVGIDSPQALQLLSGECPASAQAAYRTGAACPFDSTNMSAARLCGSLGS